MQTDDFLHYLQYGKRYSSHTVSGYKTDLKQFSDYLKDAFNTTPQQATSQQIRNWLSGLVAVKLSAKTVNRKISSLNSFYQHLSKEGKMETNPMAKVTPPKIPRKLPAYVSATNMQTLIEDFEFSHDFKGLRDKLILETFYCTGIRLSELTGLKHTDISLSKGAIRVTGKGNKERIVPMVEELKSTLAQYLEEKKRLLGNDPTGYIFVTDKGKKVYPKFVYRVVNFYLSTNTTVSKRSPHVLRHSFATHMLNNGADINAIKELLGHSSLSATEVYTHNTVEKIKSVYKQAHPKA
ncbi:MAG: integrase [Bacteroidetes bacterium]|nr:MAG: integrase [Bacteroidota bacterium]